MKTLENVIHGDEVFNSIPKGPDCMRIWDDFVDVFNGKQIKYFNCDPDRSYNFKVLSPEIQAILIELTKDWEHRNHFGVYIE